MSFPISPHHALRCRAGDLVATNWYGQTLGTGDIDFGTDYGMRVVNPYDTNIKYQSAPIVDGHGAAPLAHEYLNEGDISILGKFHGDDPDDLRNKLEVLGIQLENNNQYEVFYLRFGTNDPATSMVYRRIYVKYVGMSAPYHGKTQYHMTDLVELLFRSHDPRVYDDTISSDENTTSGGTMSELLSVGGNLDTAMHRIKIENHLTSNTVNTPTITLLNGSFTLSGTLTAQNDYWDIDCYRGKVTKWTSGGSSSADDIANFSGQFPELTESVDIIQASSVGGTEFKVYNDWLARYR